MMEQLTNEQIDHARRVLTKAWPGFQADSPVDALCDMAKAIGELAKAIHYPDCWCTTAYPTLADALAQVYATFQCTNADTHPDLTRLDLIGELTSPEYISRLRGVMGEVVDEEPREVLAKRLIDAWCADKGRQIPWAKVIQIVAIVTKQPDAERDELLRLGDENGECGMCGRSDASPVAGEVKG